MQQRSTVVFHNCFSFHICFSFHFCFCFFLLCLGLPYQFFFFVALKQKRRQGKKGRSAQAGNLYSPSIFPTALCKKATVAYTFACELLELACASRLDLSQPRGHSEYLLLFLFYLNKNKNKSCKGIDYARLSQQARVFIIIKIRTNEK